MLRIAGLQFIGHADRTANVASAERLVREAAARGAKIACLPELFNTMIYTKQRGLSLVAVAVLSMEPLI